MSYNNQQDSFFATLYSTDSVNYFPANKSSDFRNRLQKPILSDGELEVGLVELHYSDNFEPESPAKQKPPPKPVVKPPEPVPTKKKFFNSPKDGIVNTQLFSQVIRRYKKQSDAIGLKTFISQVSLQIENDEGREFNLRIAFKEKIGQELSQIQITYSTTTGYTLEFSQELAEVMGFTTRSFLPGTYLSEGTIDPEKFKTFSTDLEFSIKLWKYHRDTVTIQEPEDFDWEEFGENLSDAIAAKGHKVRFLFDGDEKAFVYIDTNNFAFQLSKRINRLLGLDEQYWFTKPQEDFIVPGATEIPVAPPPSPEKPEEPKAKKNLLLVHSNLVYPQYFGNCMLPILRTVARPKSINSETILKFESVHYLPLKDSHVSSIHLQLSDEHLNLLPSMDKPTTVLLHFRSRY